MNPVEKADLLEEVAHNVGMVRTFHQNDAVADELLALYDAYQEEGVSITEMKLFAEDLRRFLGKEV